MSQPVVVIDGTTDTHYWLPAPPPGAGTELWQDGHHHHTSIPVDDSHTSSQTTVYNVSSMPYEYFELTATHNES